MSSGTSILKSLIDAVNPKDRACAEHKTGLWKVENVIIGTSKGLKKLTKILFVGYSTGQPLNLAANLRSFEQTIKDLNAFIVSEDLFFNENLRAYINTFLLGEKNLKSFIRNFMLDFFDLNSFLRMWKQADSVDLFTNIDMIEPLNLIGALRASRKGTDQYKGIIRGWYYDDIDLNTLIQPYVEEYISANIKAVLPKDLSSYIKVWPYKDLLASLQGWAVFDLLAKIAVREERSLFVTIAGHYPKDLHTIIKTIKFGSYNLSAGIVNQHIFDITSKINCFNRSYSNFVSTIVCDPIYLLKGSIVGWANRDLYAVISSKTLPQYLNAKIISSGGYKNLDADVLGLFGTKQNKNLYAIVSGWRSLDLISSVFSIGAVSLMASIISTGGTIDLKADIKVKEIIFNEFYRFSTANTFDLRAYVGFSLCTLRTPRSAYKSLMSSILSIPVYDLKALINGIKVMYSGTKNLGVLINYSNKYSMLFKFLSFKMSTSISDCVRYKPAFSKNLLNITFKIINGQTNLKALLKAQPHNLSLGATIRSKLLIIHGRSNEKVLTEELVEIEDCKKRWSDYVDVYLNIEKPLYYSDGKVFSKNYNYPIISFLFKRNSNIGLNYEYSLRHDLYFDSTDSAIRYGLLKVSGKVGVKRLTAKIQPVVKNLKLNAKIEGIVKEPIYSDSPFTYLKSGSVSFMGTCINHVLHKSRTSVFSGIQDIKCNISAVPN